MNLGRRVDGPRTLAGQAELAIQDAIVDGELAPGSRLTIDELARAINMSPMPVRDALRKLAQTGFVEYVPHRGATVALLSVEDLRDTWDARIALETLAIRRACERFDETHAAVVEDAIARHAEALAAHDAPEAQEAHRDVHMGLYKPSGYNWLDRLVQPVWILSERYRSYALVDRGGPEQIAEEHREILAACERHDAEAATGLLYIHLVRTANIVAEKLVGAALFALTPPLSLGEVSRPAVASTE